MEMMEMEMGIKKEMSMGMEVMEMGGLWEVCSMALW